MKIYINRKPITGPWGGGSKFVNKLCDKINNDSEKNITFSLERDIDVIFCFDPRPNSDGIWYQDFINYKNAFPNTKIIQRVGDVGSHSKPELTKLLKEIINSNYTDFFIFPSNWAREYIGHTSQNFKVIKNRPDNVFFENRIKSIDKEKIKIVTHHWSTNKKKGFGFYEEIGDYFLKNKLKGKEVELTYIGRYNEDFKRNGWNVIEPVDKKTLSTLLPKNDIYLTASIEEAGANHVLEAIASGLPVIYSHHGGSINEYCKDFGLSFSNKDSFLDSLEKIVEEIEKYKEKTLKYSENIENTICEYLDCIESLFTRF